MIAVCAPIRLLNFAKYAGRQLKREFYFLPKNKNITEDF
jgi:hypothetical protein